MSKPEHSGGLSLAEAQAILGDRKIHRMSSNENPIGTSQVAIDAMTRAAQGINLYPARTDADLRAEIAATHDVEADQIFMGLAGCEVIEFAFRTLISKGENFVVCPPTFGVYYLMADRYDVELRTAPLDKETFALDIDGIIDAIDEQTRFVVLINPNNPTGTYSTHAEYQALLSRLPAHVIVLADEVYFQFVSAPDYADTVSLLKNGANIVRIHSFAKAYGMAGLRLGYGIAPAAIAEKMRGLMRPFHVNSIALEGASAALTDADFVRKTVANNAAGKSYLYSALDAIDVRYWQTEANFILIETPIPSAEMTERLLYKAIMVRDPKDAMIPNCIRVTVGTPEQNAAFIAALTEVLRELQSA